MLRGTDRIMTTHAGALPRSDALRELVFARSNREAYDKGALATGLRDGVAQTVAFAKYPNVYVEMSNQADFAGDMLSAQDRFTQWWALSVVSRLNLWPTQSVVVRKNSIRAKVPRNIVRSCPSLDSHPSVDQCPMSSFSGPDDQEGRCGLRLSYPV